MKINDLLGKINSLCTAKKLKPQPLTSEKYPRQLYQFPLINPPALRDFQCPLNVAVPKGMILKRVPKVLKATKKVPENLARFLQTRKKLEKLASIKTG